MHDIVEQYSQRPRAVQTIVHRVHLTTVYESLSQADNAAGRVYTRPLPPALQGLAPPVGGVSLVGLTDKDAVRAMAKWDYRTLQTWVAVFVDACLPGMRSTATPLITLEIIHTVALTSIVSLLNTGDALRQMIRDIHSRHDYLATFQTHDSSRR